MYLGTGNEAEHSVTVVATDGTVDGTTVNGLGGLEQDTHTDNLAYGWPSAAGVAIFKKDTPNRVANAAEVKTLTESVSKSDER